MFKIPPIFLVISILLFVGCTKLVTVNISSEPNSVITLNGLEYTTPAELELVVDSNVEISFNKEGYHEITRNYFITEELDSLHEVLELKSVKLSISINHDDCEIYLNGEAIKNVTLVKPGEYNLLIKNDTYVDYENNFSVKINENKEVNVNLENKKIEKLKDTFVYHNFVSLTMFEKPSDSSNVLGNVHATNIYEVIGEYYTKKWLQIELENGTVGWIKNSMFLEFLSLKELDHYQAMKNDLKKELISIEIPEDEGLLSYEYLISNQFGPFNGRFGNDWKFYSDGAFEIFEKYSGVGKIYFGLWTVQNGYLVLKFIESPTNYRSGYKVPQDLVYNLYIDNSKPYSNENIRLVRNSKYGFYRILKYPDYIIVANDLEIDPIYEKKSLHKTFKLKKDPFKEEFYEFYIGNNNFIDYIEKGHEFNIIGSCIIDGIKWYYIDSMTDVWLSPSGYHFGWIESSKID